MNIKYKLKKMGNLLNNISENKKTILSATLGAGIFGIIGNSVGIAMLGTAIVGTVPFAITGALISGLCYKVYSLLNNKEKKDL